MFVGGLLFGYGMVLSNGCGSRALVLLGRGNLRSLVVVIVLGDCAEMTLKGLIAPGRIALLQWTQITAGATSMPALIAKLGVSETSARSLAAPIISAALMIFAFLHAPFQRAGDRSRPASSSACWSPGMVCYRLSRRRRIQSGAGDLAGFHRTDRRHPAISDAVDRLDAELRYCPLAGVFAGSLVTALATQRFHWEGYSSPRHMLRSSQVRC